MIFSASNRSVRLDCVSRVLRRTFDFSTSSWDNLINCGETPGSITFINDSACVMLGIHRRHAIVVYRRSREFIAK